MSGNQQLRGQTSRKKLLSTSTLRIGAEIKNEYAYSKFTGRVEGIPREKKAPYKPLPVAAITGLKRWGEAL